MTSSAAPARAVARALVAATALLALAAPAQATEPERANFDSRPDAARGAPPGDHARDRLRERLGRFGLLTLDERSATVRAVGRLDSTLTGPSNRDGGDVALGYLREHAQAFGLDSNDIDGLRLVDRSIVGRTEHLAWEQRYRGVPAADAKLAATVTGSGRLLVLTGPPAADLAVRSIEPAISARTAYAAARRSAGATGSAATVSSSGAGPERSTRFADGGRASLTLYRSGNGYRLAWRVLAPVSSTGVYDVLVDARSDAAVRRANRVKFADAKVFEYTPATRPQIDQPFDRWLTSTTSLAGANAHVFTDEHDVVPFRPGQGEFDLTPESEDSEVASPYDAPLHTFPGASAECPGDSPDPPTTACTWDPSAPASWDDNRKQSATQLFYFVNVFHDHLASDDIAFTDKSFQMTDKPLGDPNGNADPAASDPVIAQALDGAAGGTPDVDHVNNSNFLALPDGLPGLMQMYLWNEPFGNYDGSNDASLVFHEYTHGLSERLITDADGYGALNSAQAGAMAEGWSDFYAMDYLVSASLEPDDPGVADVRFGEYLDNGDGLTVRFQPIDCEPASTPVAGCPDGGTSEPDLARDGGFTYADFGQIDDAPEVHSDGEIWAQTLWSLRDALSEAHPDDGIARARRYVTQAMRLSPPEPSFLDMRNAILQASPGGPEDLDSDDALLWTVFAERGMGYFAGSEGSEDTTPVADFTDPAELTRSGTISGTVVDQDAKALAGVTVGIAGFDNGLGPQHTATTLADGEYTIANVPADGTHTYPVVRARKAGYTEGRTTEPVAVPPDGTKTLDFQLTRDWSSSAGTPKATVMSFTGPDNTSFGCGPGGLIDDDAATVWGSSRRTGGQAIVVELAAPVDVARVAIDPSAGCGDDETASLGAYEVLGSSAPGGPFTLLRSGVFTSGELGDLREVFLGTALGVRYITLRAKSPQSTAAGTSGEHFLDVAELHVEKVPLSPLGAAVDTGAATAIGPGGATLRGTVVPHGASAPAVFDYGTTTAYGARVSAGVTGAGSSAKAIAAAVSGLKPSTTYHFRLVVLRDGHEYRGGDATFRTAAAPSPIPTPTPTPTATPAPAPQPQPPVAKATSVVSKTLKASRKGFFKVKAYFAENAPLGKARITVKRKGKRLARARTPVRQGRTVTKTLRLSRKGRRVIRRGRKKRVTLELRLPGGQKIKQSLMLKRRR